MNAGDRLGLVCAVVGIAVAVTSQIPGRARHTEVKETSDVYLLPPPEQLTVMSLGYRAAVADVLWANVLVTQGLRLGERRRFDVAIEYLDAINELDPKWRDPYKMTDSLVTLQAKATPMDQIRAVRRILERGVRERPTDAELWLILGQFTAQIVPGSYLYDDPVEAKKWQQEGSEYLARAAELAPADSNIQWQAMGAARHFAIAGRLDRAIDMYSAILATTDDPELRAEIESLLALAQREKGATERELHRRDFNRFVIDELPGLSVGKALLLGPSPDPAGCAGGARRRVSDVDCAFDWETWGADRQTTGR